jgi:radical SAM protein with 4Fe4S-binding SPASM domain
MKRFFSAPTMINLELTELCNVKCRHCYNFWRDENMGSVTMDREQVDRTVDRFHEARVFHVGLSGGEPFAKFDILEYAIHKFAEKGITINLNSSLMLATDELIQRLAATGNIEHILTSLVSCSPAVTDFAMNQAGAFDRVVAGIKTTVRNGLRVSANMVVTRQTKDQVYDTAMLAAEIGCQKMFVTRAVPPVYVDTSEEDNYTLTPEEVKKSLDDALQAKEDSGMMIGTLVSYPLCFLGDLRKYEDFVGRGCPSQSGNRMSINPDGEAHVCVHEDESYGNIFETPIQEIFQKRARKWHDGSFHYSGCTGCEYLDVCEAGCRMIALGQNGDHTEKDPLFVGPNAVTRKLNTVRDSEIFEKMKSGFSFFAPKRLRFREEGGFYLLNIRWGNTLAVPWEVGEFLLKYRDSGAEFTLDDFGQERQELLAYLFDKDAVESHYYLGRERKSLEGLGLRIEDLDLVAV